MFIFTLYKVISYLILVKVILFKFTEFLIDKLQTFLNK